MTTNTNTNICITVNAIVTNTSSFCANTTTSYDDTNMTNNTNIKNMSLFITNSAASLLQYYYTTMNSAASLYYCH